MKYVNKKTGMIWENDDVEWVVNLINNNDNFELYQENKSEEIVETDGVKRYIEKPKKTKK